MKTSSIITGVIVGVALLGGAYRLGQYRAERAAEESAQLTMTLFSGMKQQAFVQQIFDLRQGIRSIALEGGEDRALGWAELRDRKLLPPNVYGADGGRVSHLYAGDWHLGGTIRHPVFTLAILPQDACVIEAQDAQATAVKVNGHLITEKSRASAMAACAETANSVELSF